MHTYNEPLVPLIATLEELRKTQHYSYWKGDTRREEGEYNRYSLREAIDGKIAFLSRTGREENADWLRKFKFFIEENGLPGRENFSIDEKASS